MCIFEVFKENSKPNSYIALSLQMIKLVCSFADVKPPSQGSVFCDTYRMMQVRVGANYEQRNMRPWHKGHVHVFV